MCTCSWWHIFMYLLWQVHVLVAIETLVHIGERDDTNEEEIKEQAMYMCIYAKWILYLIKLEYIN